MTQYLTVTIAWELICFVSAIIFLRKENNLLWKANIIFLLIVIIIEEMGRHFNITGQGKKNYLVYNLLTIPEAFFVSGMFYQILKDYTKPLLLVIGGLVLVMGSYIFEGYKHPIAQEYLNTTITVMSVVFSFYGFLYIYLLIRSEGYVVLRKHAPFWWATGALIYYFGGLATDLLFAIFHLQGHISSKLYSYIYMALNTLMYAFRSYSFRCRYLQKNSNSL
ncbi:hypothetical protein ACFFGT_06235 [Mucilaginibacter angelicae]|uniref:Uncharacterized protein n=1 Tax=Mucilaginibacter angelicae TaxID=869718 RepID=A0ABV6L247_9SPHI